MDKKEDNDKSPLKKSRSRSLSKSRSPRRSKSRSKSPYSPRRSRSRSPRSFSRSRSPPRRRYRSSSKSYSRSPVRRTPTPEPTTLHIDKLTRNVTRDHLYEIFGVYGKVKNVDVLWDRRANLSRGAAYIEFFERADADNAQIHMDGGQIDGNVIKATFVLPRRRTPPRFKRRFSPRGGRRGGFRGGRGGPMRRSPPRRRGGRRSPYRGGGGRRSPRRSYSRSPSRSRSRSPPSRSRSRSYSPR